MNKLAINNLRIIGFSEHGKVSVSQTILTKKLFPILNFKII